MMIFCGFEPPISHIGVCYVNTPKGWWGMVPVPVLDLMTLLKAIGVWGGGGQDALRGLGQDAPVGQVLQRPHERRGVRITLRSPNGAARGPLGQGTSSGQGGGAVVCLCVGGGRGAVVCLWGGGGGQLCVCVWGAPPFCRPPSQGLPHSTEGTATPPHLGFVRHDRRLWWWSMDPPTVPGPVHKRMWRCRTEGVAVGVVCLYRGGGSLPQPQDIVADWPQGPVHRTPGTRGPGPSQGLSIK